MKRNSLLFAAAVLLSIPVLAPNPAAGLEVTREDLAPLVGTITGTVTEPDGDPLPGASVRLVGTSLTTRTDQNGRFTLARVPDGSYQLAVTYIGYQEAVQSVTVSGGTSNLAIRLTPQAIAIEGVTVMGGLTQGQAKALQQQKNAENIQNVVSEEQIQRFPDRSAAEAVQRMPGIYNRRDDGEGTELAIRGLAAEFNQVTINGQVAPSPEQKRGNRLDVIQSDLVKQITVTKALTPEMDGAAIGGSVDFQLAEAPERPLVSFNLGYGATDAPNLVNSDWGNDNRKGRLALGRRFLDDRLGVLVSGSYDRYTGGYLLEQWNYQTRNGSATDTIVNFRRHQDRDTRRVRRGAVGNIDYEFNLDHRIHLIGSYSNYAYDKINRRMDIRQRVQKGKLVVTDQFAHGNEFIDRGTTMAELGGESRLGAMQLDYAFTASRATRDNPYDTDLVFTRSNPGLAKLSNGEWRSYQLSSDLVAAPSPYALGSVDEESKEGSEAIRSGEANLQIPLGFLGGESNLKVGGKLLAREKDYGLTYRWKGTPSSKVVLDGLGAFDRMDQTSARYQSELRPRLKGNDITEAARRQEYYDVTEQVAAGYAQTEIHLSDRLMTLFGARVERTAGEMVHLTQSKSAERDYTNVLPSFHVRYRFSPGTQLRFAATTGIARPDYGELAPYLFEDDEDLEMRRGNPDLEPTRARNLDVMFETYSSGLGLFSAGVFGKWLRDQIYRATFTEEIGGTQWEVTQPINGETAEVFGAEFAFTRQFDFMPDALAFLRPFGIYATYTRTRTEQLIGEGEEQRALPLLRVPENLTNLALTYDNPRLGLEWTLSGNYRDAQLIGVGDDEFDDRWFDAETTLDFSATKELYRKLSLFVTANNLLDTHERRLIGHPSASFVRPTVNEWYGRSFTVSIRYR